jgi:hypothetical protein
MTELTIALNFVIIFLLVTAIIYGFVLNKRINLIRESGKELSHLFRSFDDTILRAQKSVEDLKRISGAISEGLQKKIDKAALQIDELEFLREKASKAADDVSVAIANFKKLEGQSFSGGDRSGNVVAMPLVMSPPPVPGRSMVPAKPGLFKNKKALEDMIWEDTAGKKKTIVNNNIKAPVDIQENEEKIKNEKKQFSIVSALKALGYGE